MTQEPGPAIPMSERMQSLLARAVEDQLSEQRQLSVALTDVREQLARVSQELADLRSQPPSGVPGEAVDALQRAVSGLQQRVAGLTDLGDRVDALTARADQLATRDDLAALSSGMPSGGLVDRLEALEAVVAPLEQRLMEVSGASRDHSAGLDELRERFDTLAERLQAMAAGLRDQATVDGDAVAALGQRMSVLQEDMTALGSDVAGLVEGANEVSQQRVHEVVQTAVRESERRLTDHLDEAVLSLAEVLLRRWPSSQPAEDLEPSFDYADAPPSGYAEPVAPVQYDDPLAPVQYDDTTGEDAAVSGEEAEPAGAPAPDLPADDLSGEASPAPTDTDLGTVIEVGTPQAVSGEGGAPEEPAAAPPPEEPAHPHRRGWFRGKG